jgi:hypothetical protein
MILVVPQDTRYHHQKLSHFVGLDDDFPREGTMPDVDDETSFDDVLAMTARVFQHAAQPNLVETAIFHAFQQVRAQLQKPSLVCSIIVLELNQIPTSSHEGWRRAPFAAKRGHPGCDESQFPRTASPRNSRQRSRNRPLARPCRRR